MPGLQPENPDGYFLFLLQMGLAQREVDVLAQRTAGGMEAKMRAGGWPAKAPEGYVNKERQVSSNKYERWVEQDPENIEALKLAWKLLLTDRYKLDEICEELTQKGFVRSVGLPWAWNTPKTGKRKTARNRLHQIFHNPFYAGWVVSKRFNIKVGEVRGNWEPIITTEQFEKGGEILRKNSHNKSRLKSQHYLLRNLIWVKEGTKTLKLYGSTPSGQTKNYAYYVTHTPLGEKVLRLSSPLIDEQIPSWLDGISIEASQIPVMRKLYRREINTSTEDKSGELERMKRKLKGLDEEEARLGRLFMAGKISENVYDELRAEWQENVHALRRSVQELEVETKHHLDDLEVALALITNISSLYERLDIKKRTALLQVLVKQIIVNRQGEIISHELNSPFEYLSTLALEITGKEGESSRWVSKGTPTETRTQVLLPK